MSYIQDKLKEIGIRIRDTRKAAGYTQASLCEVIKEKYAPIDTQKLIDIEHGRGKKLDFDILLGLCDLFDCEMGYLLCEPGYENKTRVKTDIANETGLSQQAIERITQKIYYEDRFKVYGKKPRTENSYLNDILTSAAYTDFMFSLAACIDISKSIERNKERIKEYDTQLLINNDFETLKRKRELERDQERMINETRYALIHNASRKYENMIDNICGFTPANGKPRKE